MTALETWLSALDRHIDTDTVWPRLSRAHNIYKAGHPIKADAVNQIVARRARAAGLPDAKQYTARSLRSGFITEATSQGVPHHVLVEHLSRNLTEVPTRSRAATRQVKL